MPTCNPQRVLADVVPWFKMDHILLAKCLQAVISATSLQSSYEVRSNPRDSLCLMKKSVETVRHPQSVPSEETPKSLITVSSISSVGFVKKRHKQHLHAWLSVYSAFAFSQEQLDVRYPAVFPNDSHSRAHHCVL